MEYLLNIAKQSNRDEQWVCDQLVIEFGEHVEELVAV